MKKIILLFCLQFIYLSAVQLMAQVSINNTGTLPHPNAMLDINGVRKGLLIPRGDAAFRTFLNTNTAKGLLMYDTIDNNVWVHNGNGLANGWKSLAGGPDYWQQSGALGTEIKNTNSGGFWSANTSTVTSDPGIIQPPVSGGGTRLMWLPQKGAFRAGTVYDNQWDAANVGLNSFAGGSNSSATGSSSTAMGSNTNASGISSLAMGNETLASGSISTAMGNNTQASGSNSTAMGSYTRAGGSYSTAIGFTANSSGEYSIALGNTTVSHSHSSISMGRYNDSIISSSSNDWVASDPLMIVGNGESNVSRHNAMVLYKNGNLVLKNPTTVISEPASFNVPISGEGTRLMWLPQKSAFRVGTVGSFGSEVSWDAANIGTFSFASGVNSLASGQSSTAMGESIRAMGNHSTALGFFTTATGLNSTAMGGGTSATGENSTAIGNQTSATGLNSTAMGFGTDATGENSTAMGDLARASGVSSTAMGSQTLASGISSTAMGSQTKASSNSSTAMGSNTKALGLISTTMGQYTVATGENSTAMGFYTTARSYASVAMGYFNDSIAGSSQILPISTDPLLIVGNGTFAARSNALVVYKNGNMDINGFTQLGKTSEAAPSIKMKEFSANTAAAQGNWTDVQHDLTASKILSVSILVNASPGFDVQVPPFYSFYTGYQYQYHISATNIVIINSTTNSFNILNKPMKILVTYKE